MANFITINISEFLW